MRKQAATRQSDVLQLLEKQAKPMTAYALLEQLRPGEPNLAAPTIYRTLAALTEQGRAHKLESINAFVACRCAHDTSVPILAICDECGMVEEHDGAPILPKLKALEERSAFQATRHIVEIHGRCQSCAA